MAKRGRNLAALAALGALGYGYMARGDKQDGTKVPVEIRKNPASAAPAAAAIKLEDDFAERETGIIPQDPRGLNEYGERYTLLAGSPAAPARSAAPARAAAAAVPMEVPSRGRREMLKNPQRGPSMADIQQKNEEDRINALRASGGMRAKGGAIKMASGGMTASKRADGCAQRGKTKGRMV